MQRTPRVEHIALAATALTLVLGARPALAQSACSGDCDGSRSVAINELITCVGIALGSAAASSCTACDADGGGSVAINELIAAVNAALAGTCGGPAGAICGDGDRDTDAGEQCDDGNTRGGDGCAANCTDETRRLGSLDSTRSRATVQLRTIPIAIPLSGQEGLTLGRARDTAVVGPDGEEIFRPGEIPVVLAAQDVRFNAVIVPGFVCACVRAVPVPEFGDGISGVGVIGCGADGLTDVSFTMEQDHNTTPGDPGNSGPSAGLPDDPECDDTFDAGGGITSSACREGSGATCSKPSNEHPGVCNSPRVVTFFGGQSPRGSVLLRNSTAIGLLRDSGTCDTRGPRPGRPCGFPDYGPDCLPCTEDDVETGTINLGPTTTGTARVAMYDVGSDPGAVIGVGGTCGGTASCVGEVVGAVSDCDALEADPNAPLNAVLVTAFPGIDQPDIGDAVTTTTLALQP